MNWLFDRPATIAFLGAALCIPIAIAWVMTGKKQVLYALGAAFTVMVALLITERMVVTDREAIEAMLPQLARDVQNNDLPKVATHVYSGAPTLKQKVQGELHNYHFTECRITKLLEIKINEQAEPRSAEVSFLAAAAGDFKAEGTSFSFAKEAPIRRHVTLQLRRENDGRWTVEDYSHAEVTSAFFQPKESP
jgi:hypothetical protein